MNITIVAVAFWIFVAVAAVSGIVADVIKRRQVIDMLRSTVEKGQAVDPAVVEKMLNPALFGKLVESDKDRAIDGPALQLGGIITLAAGVGLAVFALFLSHVWPASLYVLLGLGALTVCVGLGLVIAARMLRGRQAG